MEHRRLLAHPEAHRPFAGGNLFLRIGGGAAVEALVNRLYDGIETDAVLRPLFSRDLAGERAGQKRFFTEWFDGGSDYSACAHLPLKHRHDLLPITPMLAERWLAHFRRALAAAVPDREARRAIDERVSILALALVNEDAAPSALRAQPHGVCLRYPPAIESVTLARRGDAAALCRLVERAPDILASVPHAARLLHLAVLAGRKAVVELLLDAGVDVNTPSPVEPLILVSPLCSARVKGRGDIEALLLGRGAQEDIFTQAFVGELDRLRVQVARGLAQAVDPAVDALQVTPVHHAVAGERPEALQTLLSGVRPSHEPLLNGGRALRDAATRQNVAMVAQLLDHGVSAGSIGAGRWVVHRELAPMLARAGAHVDRSGSWIGLACTGNQGRRDDPAFVEGLLRHGARVDDRRMTGQRSDGGRATALHYAARAGFVRTIELLLTHGADPVARDDNGRTPLEWLERAAPSVDRQAVRRLLQRSRRP